MPFEQSRSENTSYRVPLEEWASRKSGWQPIAALFPGYKIAKNAPGKDFFGFFVLLLLVFI